MNKVTVQKENIKLMGKEIPTDVVTISVLKEKKNKGQVLTTIKDVDIYMDEPLTSVIRSMQALIASSIKLQESLKSPYFNFDNRPELIEWRSKSMTIAYYLRDHLEFLRKTTLLRLEK